jgi:hypothetical protein
MQVDRGIGDERVERAFRDFEGARFFGTQTLPVTLTELEKLLLIFALKLRGTNLYSSHDRQLGPVEPLERTAHAPNRETEYEKAEQYLCSPTRSAPSKCVQHFFQLS